jgi:leucyl/phenylalanyl-tRNA---protein transferase
MNELPVVDADGYVITPEVVIAAYSERCFPMADARKGFLRWYRPDRRAVITWDRWKVPRSLAKRVRQRPYRIEFDTAFAEVIAACAERKTTWISRDIERLYTELHRRGIGHSVEAYDGEGKLVGGLYGLALGGCFCGESMFHSADDAAKVCVVALAERLQECGYSLIDCQQQTPHMQRFGAYEVSDEEYAKMLERAPGPGKRW